MYSNNLPPVAGEKLKRHVLFAMQRYWFSNAGVVADLPVRRGLFPEVFGPLRLVYVLLPEWAVECGVEGRLAVPSEACPNPDYAVWEDVDWWLASFLMLECWHERVWELENGPIHSYSLRLKGWDTRVWDYAWVNRIALFFRMWAAQINGKSEEQLFDFLLASEIVMTHDVDAVAKTLPIRIKQGCFNLFNALRALVKGDLRVASDKFTKALRFLFGCEDWWTLDTLLNFELKHNLHSRFHFYADSRKKTPKRWLFDPGYDVHSQKLKPFICRLVDSGLELGLHPSFDSWQEPTLIRNQKANLEAVVSHPSNVCRQHWLRFSWEKTWSAQEVAGIVKDTTLMFNDRSGFRNASALAWNPWQAKGGKAHQLTALPTVLMDSHFYDYQPMTSDVRRKEMERWVQECRAVFGQIAVLWHPHTLTKDYGWSEGFEELVTLLTGKINAQL